ncbi:dynein regulatory complex subunit 3 [Vigna radiata var. radiata]|uniref:Dynein regulatory complex subunit 3 n=1 Tax=Vigna radiata var. radiata TaxID=3916 RepID=A0A1S3VWB5_VIGRR|nr:dynein regulatory complex subunit 3 [Vigna radiata var. radiata]
MTRLNVEQVLKDNNASDPSSVTTLHLTYKALSDITCLANFIKLEKLDLKLNNLTSLEGLRSCANLKWLSVVENKLESLEGIQGLTKLTVLNAGKNKLKSIDQVASVVSLRALILNENNISSICKLDQLKELNTLVLSKNPIHKIGDALLKVKSITKLSLSHCQLQGIDTSLKSCVELSELRLAHNEIKSLPDELKFNSKLRNLDVGNNVITRWSEVKVVKLLTNLRNLNLQGNPVATVDKITRKIKKALPRLQIFNARPVDKDTENKQSGVVDGTPDFSVDQTGQNLKDSTEKSARFHTKDKKKYDHLEGPDDLDSERKEGKKRKKTDVSKKEERVIDEGNKAGKKDKADRKKDSLIVTVDPDMENKSTKKKVKKDEKVLDNKGFAPEENVSKVGKKVKKKRKNEEESELDIIDNAEASFAELFKINHAENENHGDEMKAQEKVSKDVKVAGSAVTSFAKPKNAKMQNMESLSFPVADIGNGGPSTWGDE